MIRCLQAYVEFSLFIIAHLNISGSCPSRPAGSLSSPALEYKVIHGLYFILSGGNLRSSKFLRDFGQKGGQMVDYGLAMGGIDLKVDAHLEEFERNLNSHFCLNLPPLVEARQDTRVTPNVGIPIHIYLLEENQRCIPFRRDYVKVGGDENDQSDQDEEQDPYNTSGDDRKNNSSFGGDSSNGAYGQSSHNNYDGWGNNNNGSNYHRNEIDYKSSSYYARLCNIFAELHGFEIFFRAAININNRQLSSHDDDYVLSADHFDVMMNTLTVIISRLPTYQQLAVGSPFRETVFTYCTSFTKSIPKGVKTAPECTHVFNILAILEQCVYLVPRSEEDVRVYQRNPEGIIDDTDFMGVHLEMARALLLQDKLKMQLLGLGEIKKVLKLVEDRSANAGKELRERHSIEQNIKMNQINDENNKNMVHNYEENTSQLDGNSTQEDENNTSSPISHSQPLSARHPSLNLTPSTQLLMHNSNVALKHLNFCRDFLLEPSDSCLLMKLMQPEFLHVEVVKRLSEIFRFVLTTGRLPSTLLRKAWGSDNTTRHESIRHEVLSLFSQISNHLPTDQYRLVCDFLRSLPANEHDFYSFEFLRHLVTASVGVVDHIEGVTIPTVYRKFRENPNGDDDNPQNFGLAASVPSMDEDNNNLYEPVGFKLCLDILLQAQSHGNQTLVHFATASSSTLMNCWKFMMTNTASNPSINQLHFVQGTILFELARWRRWFLYSAITALKKNESSSTIFCSLLVSVCDSFLTNIDNNFSQTQDREAYLDLLKAFCEICIEEGLVNILVSNLCAVELAAFDEATRNDRTEKLYLQNKTFSHAHNLSIRFTLLQHITSLNSWRMIHEKNEVYDPAADADFSQELWNRRIKMEEEINQNPNITLTHGQVDSLWQQFVITPAYRSDSENAANLFSEIIHRSGLTSDEKRVETAKHLFDLFSELATTTAIDIGPNLAKLLEEVIFIKNESERTIMEVIKNPNTSNSRPIQTICSFDIYGQDILWNVILRNEDEEVVSRLISNLVRKVLFPCQKSIEGEKSNFRVQFVQSAMQILTEAIDRRPEPDIRGIKRTISVISRFVAIAMLQAKQNGIVVGCAVPASLHSLGVTIRVTFTWDKYKSFVDVDSSDKLKVLREKIHAKIWDENKKRERGHSEEGKNSKSNSKNSGTHTTPTTRGTTLPLNTPNNAIELLDDDDDDSASDTTVQAEDNSAFFTPENKRKRGAVDSAASKVTENLRDLFDFSKLQYRLVRNGKDLKTTHDNVMLSVLEINESRSHIQCFPMYRTNGGIGKNVNFIGPTKPPTPPRHHRPPPSSLITPRPSNINNLDSDENDSDYNEGDGDVPMTVPATVDVDGEVDGEVDDDASTTAIAEEPDPLDAESISDAVHALPNNPPPTPAPPTPAPQTPTTPHDPTSDPFSDPLLAPIFELIQQKNMQHLFGLLKMEEITEQVWTLLMALPTENKLQQDLEDILPTVTWEELIPSSFEGTSDTCRLLYSLLLVEANVSKAVRSRNRDHTDQHKSYGQRKVKNKNISPVAQQKNDWADLFVSTGGLNHIIAIFTRFTTQVTVKTAKTNRSILAMEKIISFCIGENRHRDLKKLPSKAALKSIINASWWTLNDLLAHTPASATNFLTQEGYIHSDYSPHELDEEDRVALAELEELEKTATQTLQQIMSCLQNQPDLVVEMVSAEQDSETLDALKGAILSSLVRTELKAVRVKSSKIWQECFELVEKYSPGSDFHLQFYNLLVSMIPSFCSKEMGESIDPDPPQKKKRGSKKSRQLQQSERQPDDKKYIPFCEEAFTLLKKLTSNVKHFFDSKATRETGAKATEKVFATGRRRKKSPKKAVFDPTSDDPPTISSEDNLYELLAWIIEKVQINQLFETDEEIADRRLLGYMGLANELLILLPDAPDNRALLLFLCEKCIFDLPTSANHGTTAPPLCKTSPSVETAFSLVSTLCKTNEVNMEVLIDYIYGKFLPENPANFDFVRHDLDAQYFYDPSNQAKASAGYVGLRNLSCTCYMNSLLQQFYMLPGLRAGILSCRDILSQGEEQVKEVEAKEEDKEEEEEEEEVDNLLYQLQNLFGNLQESERRAFDTAGFCNSYKDFDGNPTNPSEQQDVDEFLAVLMDRIETLLKPHEVQKNLLKEHFGGTFLNQIICQECKNVSERAEDSLVIPVDVKGKGTVQDSLKFFCKGEMLEGDNQYFCEHCSAKCDSLKRVCVGTLPSTLILHLKRFEFDLETMRKIKVNDHLQFPMELDMYAYTKAGLEEEEVREMGEGGEKEKRKGQGGAGKEMYELRGVLVHTGTADSGHYFSIINNEREKDEGEETRWFEFNDSTVTEFDEERLADQCFGGCKQTNQWDVVQQRMVPKQTWKPYSAYLLVYDKKKANVEEDAATAVRGKRKLAAEGATANTRDKEVERAISEELYSRIWKRNEVFLRDKLILGGNFGKWLLDFCASNFPVVTSGSGSSNGSSSSDTSSDSSDGETQITATDVVIRVPPKLLQTVTIFIFEFLIHTKEKKKLISPLLAWTTHHFKVEPEMCRWFLQLLVDTELHYIFQGILKPPQPETRNKVLRLFSAVLTTYFRDQNMGDRESYYDLEPDNDEMEDNGGGGEGVNNGNTRCLQSRNGANIEITVSKNNVNFWESKSIFGQVITHLVQNLGTVSCFWKRSEQYFELFVFLAECGVEEREFMLRAGMIRHLVDYFVQGLMRQIDWGQPVSGVSSTGGGRGTSTKKSLIETSSEEEEEDGNGSGADEGAGDILDLRVCSEKDEKLTEEKAAEMKAHYSRKIVVSKDKTVAADFSNLILCICRLLEGVDMGGEGGDGNGEFILGAVDYKILTSKVFLVKLLSETKNEVFISELVYRLCRNNWDASVVVIEQCILIFKEKNKHSYAVPAKAITRLIHLEDKYQTDRVQKLIEGYSEQILHNYQYEEGQLLLTHLMHSIDVNMLEKTKIGTFESCSFARLCLLKSHCLQNMFNVLIKADTKEEVNDRTLKLIIMLTKDYSCSRAVENSELDEGESIEEGAEGDMKRRRKGSWTDREKATFDQKYLKHVFECVVGFFDTFKASAADFETPTFNPNSKKKQPGPPGKYFVRLMEFLNETKVGGEEEELESLKLLHVGIYELIFNCLDAVAKSNDGGADELRGQLIKYYYRVCMKHRDMIRHLLEENLGSETRGTLYCLQFCNYYCNSGREHIEHNDTYTVFYYELMFELSALYPTYGENWLNHGNFKWALSHFCCSTKAAQGWDRGGMRSCLVNGVERFIPEFPNFRVELLKHLQKHEYSKPSLPLSNNPNAAIVLKMMNMALKYGTEGVEAETFIENGAIHNIRSFLQFVWEFVNREGSFGPHVVRVLDCTEQIIDMITTIEAMWRRLGSTLKSVCEVLSKLEECRQSIIDFAERPEERVGSMRGGAGWMDEGGYDREEGVDGEGDDAVQIIELSEDEVQAKGMEEVGAGVGLQQRRQQQQQQHDAEEKDSEENEDSSEFFSV